MATMIFVDQENGDIAVNLSKDRVKLSTNTSNSLSRKGPVSFPGKVFGTSRTVEKASRKALGNVNKQVETQKVNAQKADSKKTKKSVPVKVSSSAECPTRPVKEDYPEIETFSPYNPLDFERFEVPEDHKLSHLCLAGIPLMVHETEAARFDALVNAELSPMKMLPLTWESDTADSLPSFLATLEEITLDMPPIEY
ncbi:securin [Rhinophrynus dorsalis]